MIVIELWCVPPCYKYHYKHYVCRKHGNAGSFCTFHGCVFSVYAGSWHTRGHSSTLGLGMVIDAHTTLVLDFEVLSKKCSTCAGMRTKFLKKKIQEEHYNTWKREHAAVCNLNYEGSSGGMEELQLDSFGQEACRRS